MINHRYHRLRVLGAGGGGEVFLVEDALKETRQCAMKVLHGGDHSGSVPREQFRKEASVLAGLQHQNLVKIFDFGTVRQCDDAALLGRRFLTMEWVRGSTVLEWWHVHRKHETGPALLKQVVLQTLAVLYYVHRRGIIHFDIKPDNLLLLSGGESDDHTPLLKLTDFGLSAVQSEILEFPLRGTLEYTAPELLRGETYDFRADLYSLGVTLFQILEDRCPFEAGDPVGLIKKVLTEEPQFHCSVEPQYSWLFPLVTALLQKDPARRYDSWVPAVRGLLRENLEALQVFEWFPKPAFIGREEEKALISPAIASLGGAPSGDSPVAILLSGAEGIGKTALLKEMERLAQAQDVPVFSVAALQRDLPFGAMFSLLPYLRAEAMSRSTEGVVLVQRYAEAIGAGPGAGEPRAEDLRVRWMWERDRVIETQARFLNQLSLLFPLLLIIDDAHLLDGESADVLRTVARDARPGRLLILAAQSGEGNQTLPARRMELKELDARSVSAMSDSVLLSSAPGEVLGARLHELYGGSPAVVVEALHAVSALFPIQLPDAAGLAPLVEHVLRQLPRNLDELLSVRYKALDRGRQLTLEVLSCFVQPARPEIVQAVLPFQPQRTAAYLALLEAAGLVALHEDGQRVSMRHGKLKAVVHSGIRESGEEIHLFIASAIEGKAGVRTFVDLQELALQYREGGRLAESVRWLEAAGDEGLRVAGYRRARELFQEALLLGKDVKGADSDRLNAKLAHSHFRCGEFREAVVLAEEQLRKEPRGSVQRTLLHKTAGLAQSRLGEYGESKHHILAALQGSDDAEETLELQQELAGIEIALGNFAEAGRVSSAQLSRAEELGNARIIASIHTDLGIAAFFQDLFDASAAHFEEAMRIYAASGQQARLADAKMNIANVMSAKGEILQAVEHWNEALKTSLEHGTLHQQAQIQNNLGIAHSKLKHFQEARSFFEKARAIFSRLDSRQGSADLLTNLGELNLAEGFYEQALAVWQDAHRLYREMDDGQGILETLLQLAHIHLVLGLAAPVGSILDDAEALMKGRSLETFRCQLLTLRGMHLMFLGRDEEACSLFAAAEEGCREGAGRERRLLVKVRRAECEHRLGSDGEAARHAGEVELEGKGLPQVVAEALYVLGSIAVSSPSTVPEKALPIFRKGLDVIAREPVTEVTWKLAVALGEEFRKRGQSIKAKECFREARVVLRYFLSHFSSPELKESYLGVDNRRKVLEMLEADQTM